MQPAPPPRGAGMLHLVGPKWRTRVHRAKSGEGRVAKALVLGLAGIVFWGLVFAVIVRMLLYFRGAQGIGDLLAAKLLAMAFLTFLGILLVSNVITALSTFFLAEDLELLVAAPIDRVRLYGARLTETVADSSWMVVLLAVPLLLAYGVVYGGGAAYYLLAVVAGGAFLIVPAVVGSAFTLVLVNLFPARRTRDLLALVGLFAVAGLVALFRFLRPERLMRPEEFRDLVDFVAVLRTPSSAWLPSEWITEALMTHLNGVFDPFPFLLLVSTAAAFVVLGAWLHQRAYGSGFSRAQEGAESRGPRRRYRWLDLLLARARPDTRELVRKDVRTFFRDSTQWSQLVLLAVLVVVYVYNIMALPLYTGEQLTAFLINLIAFLNLGLAGFVVAAIAARFVFPAISLEGRMRWLLDSSPSDVRRLFRVKYWVGTVPLLLVALPLIVATNVFMEVSAFIMALTAGTMVAVTFALTALALGMGALFPNYETENAAEIPTSFGGLLFMMGAVSYLGLVVLLEAWPIWRVLRSRARGGPEPWWLVALGLALALAATALTVWLPLRAGIRRVGAKDA
jgi:ABC-2 type transport system permease protein